MRLLRTEALQSRPRVTVVIPNYNYERYVGRAIASALDQPGVDVDVLVADNGSTDGSVEYIRALAADDPRIRLTTRPANIPYIENFNGGIAAATGDYTVVLCSDDLLAPGSLARATAFLEARPDVAFVYGHCPTFDDAPPAPRIDPSGWTLWGGTEWITLLYMSGRNFIRHPEVVMRTSVLRDAGAYDESRPEASDMILWIRAAELGGVGRVNGADQGYFRIHGGNQHLHLDDGLLSDLTNRRDVFDLCAGRSMWHRHLAKRARSALAGHAVRFATVILDRAGPSAHAEAQRLADWALATSPGIRHRPGYRALSAALAGSDACALVAFRWARNTRSALAVRLKKHVGV
ncbi:glycosyltransferase [Tsukamurella sp. 8F]|uniref:glycosyltransferase family 2 protein n=1 Tax=Tsukamurella sp. 8F TaxID=3031961 RepID=UPI0023B95A24|nr:glycosyltransferase [Tsukamurella sp. 8F]MDF0587189.1 glycosyltransferase [Tsukamurella sp. 8F]